MGPLILPAGGTVYLDANPIIYSVENTAPYWAVLQSLWHMVQDGMLTAVTSELTLLEVLVKPLQKNDLATEAAFRSLLTSPGVQLEPVNQRVLEQAARLRATTRLRTPDAIHAATAMETRCTLFVTNDRDYRQCPGLTVSLLSDFVEP